MLRVLAKKSKWISLSLLSLLATAINLLSVQSVVLGGICLAVFLICVSALLGARVVRDEDLIIQIGVGLGVTTSFLAIGGAAIYYAGIVTSGKLFLLCALLLLIAAVFRLPEVSDRLGYQMTTRSWLALTAIVVCVAAWMFAVAPIEITQAIRSPWLVIDPSNIITLALALFLTIAIIPLLLTRLRVVLIALILLSIFIVPALTYSLGYGFDPFIHRSTVAHIAEFGTVTPKPLYYIGQYALELVATMVFLVPIFTVDTFLVPVLGAIILAGTGVYGFTQARRRAGLALFLLPLGAFISTTPQSLAYVFTGAVIFVSLPLLSRTDTQTSRALLILLALAALITHPLAGIPACLYTACVLTVANRRSPFLQAGLLLPMILASAVAIPAVFLWQATRSGLDVSFSLTNLAWNQLTLSGFWRNQFSSVFDGLYLFIDNQLWIALGFAVLGTWILVRQRADKRLHLPLLMVGLWIINYLILTLTLQFDFLIEYERTDYAQRLLTISLLFLIPPIGFAIDGVFAHLEDRPRALRVGFTVLLAALMSAGVYGAFPRHDNYARSAGFNVSTTDFDAAAQIHKLGGEDEYIVLANQAVSAAALELYGFKRYYHGDIFYYPIPTGGELYTYYLQMADQEPTRKVMEEAMDLADVNKGFFVLNDYWWDADRIAEAAKQEADSWFGVGSGDDAVMVFVFTRDPKKEAF